MYVYNSIIQTNFCNLQSYLQRSRALLIIWLIIFSSAQSVHRSVGLLVGCLMGRRSVCHNSLKGRKLNLPSSSSLDIQILNRTISGKRMKNSLRSRICKLVKRLSDSININPRNKHKMLNIDSLLSQTCVQVEPVLSTTPLHTSINPPPSPPPPPPLLLLPMFRG